MEVTRRWPLLHLCFLLPLRSNLQRSKTQRKVQILFRGWGKGLVLQAAGCHLYIGFHQRSDWYCNVLTACIDILSFLLTSHISLILIILKCCECYLYSYVFLFRRGWEEILQHLWSVKLGTLSTLLGNFEYQRCLMGLCTCQLGLGWLFGSSWWEECLKLVSELVVWIDNM